MPTQDEDLKKRTAEIEKKRDADAAKATADLKKNFAKDTTTNMGASIAGGMARNSLIHFVRRIPVIGTVFDVTRSASYIPGADEGIKKLGKKLTKKDKKNKTKEK